MFFIFSASIILPCVSIGATFPVVSKLLVHKKELVGVDIAKLYSINVFGAVFGTVLCGYWLIRFFGILLTILIASLINILLGLYLLHLTRDSLSRQRSEHTQQEMIIPRISPLIPPLMSTPNITRNIVLVIFFLTSAISILYQLCATRIFLQVIGSSVYSTTIVLSAYLAGIAFGSYIFSKFIAKRENSLLVFATIEILTGLTMLVFVKLCNYLPIGFLIIYNKFGDNYSMFQVLQFLLCLIAILFPTVFLGMMFPLVSKIYVEDRKINQLDIKQDIGKVYSLSCLGSAGGSFITGFVLIPSYGFSKLIHLGILLNICFALVLLIVLLTRTLKKYLFQTICSAGIFAVLLCLPVNIGQQYITSGVSVYANKYLKKGNKILHWKEMMERSKLIYYYEGPTVTVTVKRSPEGILSLAGNGKVEASSSYLDMPTQLLLGHLPLLIHPKPEDVCVIGLASGITLGAVVCYHEVKRIDCIEIEPVMIKASRFFSDWNNNPLEDKRVNVIVDDGRNFLFAELKKKKKYDIIISQPSNPWITGVSNLFTKEYFQLGLKNLKETGIFCQWFQAYNVSLTDLKIFFNTFSAVFPHSTVWFLGQGDCILLGSNKKLVIDYKELTRRMALMRVKGSLSKINVNHPLQLLTYFGFGQEKLTKFGDELKTVKTINTDNYPTLEFSIPARLHKPKLSENTIRSIFYNLESVYGYLTNIDRSIKFRLNLANA
ncbi:MAG: fused MFS/spermidine synthase, partial [Elusimicrobiota bacterium]|nr:fused MFS/spermidine synthase [Elusimicrobiota bacterium]